jgi:hypothetical protein
VSFIMTGDLTPGSSTDVEPVLHRRPFTKATVAALTVGLLVGTTVALTAGSAVSSTGEEGCAGDTSPLRVVAVPEMAAVVTRVVELASNRAGDCSNSHVVVAEDASVTAAAIRDNAADRPDVWIPDSSGWTSWATTPAAGLPDQNPSVARSPLTLAVSADVAADLRPGAKSLVFADLLPKKLNAAGPVRWVFQDPERSVATVGALLGLRSDVHGRNEASALFGTVVRAAHREPVSLLKAAKGSSKLAVAISEQQLVAHNAAEPARPLVAAYPQQSHFTFDYPYIVLAGERARRSEADDLMRLLRSDVGLKLLDTAGFRSSAGTAGAQLASATGIDPAVTGAGDVPDAAAVEAAVSAHDRIIRPSRLLALIDVSGSMGTPVPGARGATRLDLAVQASLSGLAVYPDDAAVGLWVFSTNLTRNTDYRSLAPISPLSRGADGISGRQRMAQGLAQVKVEKGRTGMYDSVLAAVREVRRTWDPKRVNSVVLITDGADSDRKSIGRAGLLAQLRKENDPKRPVAVFAIAYGPTGDLDTLTEISKATGGRAYGAPDPRTINRVMADAIGRRACDSGC